MAARIDIVRHLLRVWDPIGVFNGILGWAPDEYDSYVPAILVRTEAGDSAARLAEQLATIRHDRMGIGVRDACKEERTIARALVEWRDGNYTAWPSLIFAPEYAGLRLRLVLMFEWDGGCLWAGDEDARDAFDVGPIEDKLPLSAGLRDRLVTLSTWHDTALDRDDPAGPSPWGDDEKHLFEADALEMRDRLQEELGPGYLVVYESLLQADRA